MQATCSGLLHSVESERLRAHHTVTEFFLKNNLLILPRTQYRTAVEKIIAVKRRKIMEKNVTESKIRRKQSKALTWILVMAAIILAVSVLWTEKTRAATAESMVIYAIDLGAKNHGESTMVVDGTGGSLLIDTGIDEGNELFQWLNDMNYEKKKFDLLLTHWHDDHVAYAERLIRNYRIGTVYIPGTEYADNHYKRIRNNIVNAAKARKTRVVTLKSGNTISVGKVVKGEVLYVNGYRESDSDDGRRYNNQSAAIMFTGGGSRFLTCGDAQKEEERLIVQSGASVKADIFKMNHHGYIEKDATWSFIKKVAPSYAWFTTIDVRDDSEAGFRPDSVREIVRKTDSIANVFATRYNGTIRFSCYRGKIDITAKRNTSKMYRILKNIKNGYESTVTFTFNTASIPTLTKKLIDPSKYTSRQVDSKGRVFSGSRKEGSPYLRDSSGLYAVDTLAKSGGKYYLLEKNGKAYSGWKEIDGKRYYFRPERATGFTNIGKYTYYFYDQRCPGYSPAVEGTIYRGFLTIGSRRYYLIDKRLNSYKKYLDGTLAKGWRTIGDKRYHMDTHGRIAKGLVSIGGEKYLFTNYGIMLTGLKSYRGEKYWFNDYGKMVRSKPVRIKGKWYYFGPDGKAYRNRYGRINGVRYYFDKNGVGRKR